MEMKIDVTAMAKQALRERLPAEEINDALLRVAKDCYGESGPLVFQAIRAAQGAVARRNNVTLEEALHQMVEKQRSINLITWTHVTGAEEMIA